MAVEGDLGEWNLPAMVYALDRVAAVVLLELAKERGKGPWFGGLLNSIQLELAKSKAPDGAPDAVKETWAAVAMETAYDAFGRVLHDPAVPDWRPRTNTH